MKPIKFFEYYGSKIYMLKDIYNTIPPLRDKISCFVDVFGGSGVVALNLPFKVNYIIYNDLDKWLYTTFKVIQDDEKRKKLIEKLELAFRHREIFNEFKESYEKEENLEDIEIAFRYIYLTQTSYGGSINSFRTNKKSGGDYLNQPITPLKQFTYLLKNWIIENLDFRDLIKKYDSKTTFFYLDPPYLTGGKSYKFNFTIKDFKDLKDLCDNIEGYYLLNESERDFDKVKEIFGEPKFVKSYFNHIVNTKQVEGEGSYRKEGFWYNFTSQVKLFENFNKLNKPKDL
jgi:DNA adenine methylase